MGADMAKHFVEMPDAPWLAHDPWMQMEHHQASGGGAVGVKTIEPLAPQQIDLVDGAAAVEVDVIVVEIRVDTERVEFPGLWRHLVGLLVVAPVAHVADTFGREEVGGVRRLLKVGAGPADRALAGGPLDRLDRGADVLALLVLGHADMDDAAAREAVRDELGVALLALLDQKRVVVGDGLVERQGWGDPVSVQHGKDAENPDPVAVFVVAVAADIRKEVARRISAPQPLGTAKRAHRQQGAFRHLPVPVLQVDDDGERDAGVVRPPENRARNNRRPGIELLIHAIGVAHSDNPVRLAPSDWLASDSASEWLFAEEDL